MSILVLSVLCAGCALAQPPAGKYERPKDLCDALGVPFIVRGRVVTVEPTVDGYATVTVKVLHAYRGPERLVGRTFADYNVPLDRGGSVFGFPPYPPLREGEEGIWSVRPDPNDLQLGPSRDLYFLVRAQKDHAPRYEQAVLVAESIERLSKSDRDRQPELAAEYALSRTPELAGFGVRALAQARTPAAEAVLDGLVADKRLTVGGQVALDDALSLARGDAWKKSPKRLALLGRWVGGRLSEQDAVAALGRMSTVVLHGELDVPTYLGLLKTAAGNAQLPLTKRASAADYVGRLAKYSRYSKQITAADEAAGLAWLAEQVREQSEATVRLEAARQLGRLATEDARAADHVKTLLDSVREEQVRAALRGGR